ncbi:MAG: HDIG domain-containing protein [Candidatus Hydrogenedentes bacterium]|nr:HDIG domain-containing protein [Candidatus Hydrogenedentota bacterium]
MIGQFRKRHQLSPGIYRGQQQDDTRSRETRLRRVLLAVALVFLVIAVTKQLNFGTSADKLDYDGRFPAKESLIAEFGFESEDVEKTREAREASAARVPDSFHVDAESVKRQLGQFDTFVAKVNALKPEVEKAVLAVRARGESGASETAAISKAVREIADAAVTNDELLRATKPEHLAVWLTPRMPAPAEPKPDPATETKTATDAQGASQQAPIELAHAQALAAAARSGLEYVLAYGVLKPGERGSDFSKDPDRRIYITRDVPAAGQYGEDEIPLAQAYTLETVQAELKSRIAKSTLDATSTGVLPVDRVRLQDAAFEVARQYLVDTLHFDSDRTNVMREAARRETEPVMREIMAQEEIQRKGQRWTAQSRMDAKTYMEIKSRTDRQTAGITGAILAHTLLVGLALFAFVRAMPWLERNPDQRFQMLCLALLVMCATAATGRIVSYFADKGLVVPAAAGAILLAILTNARLAGFTAIVTSLLLSIQFGYSWQLLVVSAVMSLTGVMSIYKVRKRSDMGNAAVKATFAGVIVTLAISLGQDSILSSSALSTVSYSLMMVAVNGVLCLGLVPALLPSLEKLFDITTDIQLLEYSDLNNPVLSRLAMEVPATYAHSLMIGQLAEAAADAIGANGLMARVCAYYHDIGKMKRPEYFVENQTGANIHDELSPRLSARAIASHVSEGAEMARELHLPKPIIDGILEHHGTCLISFFYKEAVAQAKHGGVTEADFRYPGPRPRYRETAILMICDAVESAVRTLKNPNEERVREMVDRIIASRASDRQFDECQLTLKDLDTIAEVLTKRVASTQHRRIAYPEQKPEAPAANVIPLSGGQE